MLGRDRAPTVDIEVGIGRTRRVGQGGATSTAFAGLTALRNPGFVDCIDDARVQVFPLLAFVACLLGVGIAVGPWLLWGDRGRS